MRPYETLPPGNQVSQATDHEGNDGFLSTLHGTAQGQICLNNMAACHIQLEEYEQAITYTSMVLKHPGYEKNMKAFYRRALSEEKTDKLEESLADYKATVEVAPSFTKAHEAVERLEKAVHEKQEQQKKELLGLFLLYSFHYSLFILLFGY